MGLENKTVHAPARCPDCGTALSSDGDSQGLCPSCLLELALESPTLLAEVLDPDEAPTLGFPEAGIAEGLVEGNVLGERYRVRSLLGRGGMGEVWRAYDLKLRQDVAIKSLRRELVADPRALETLRQEVRAAREVISPNVCRVFDLQELDGQELVSMEYIDGVTLHEILAERSPLQLDEAREIASQFLAGLEAIHTADLVHQDIKPENVMVTRTGRVVVMDFGLAKGLQTGISDHIAGTPAYMSPEQSRGGEQDTRSDVYSAGVVLAEMVAPDGIRNFEQRQALWRGIHRETPKIAETPWARLIRQAVAADPSDRFASAAELARALEEVTLRAVGDETVDPYPGLSAFELEDAEYFFGRELEVEALWKKLRRPHLLAVIGPSGAGKSSFLRAGLLPTLDDNWSAILTTPGNRPFGNLARVLAPELSDDPTAVDSLLRFEEPEIAIELLADWRSRHDRALLILDQFEELFTQSSEEVQQPFAELLGRLPLEADIFVLLAMRDDFLFHCQRFESLHPVFSELTPLGPPTGASLRRAIVQPALKCGYRFEDETLVEEMLTEVEGERGSLPLVAFTAAQLWEKRDRERGLLTREAYQSIGGVGGALAQHAEATLEQIGDEGVPIVRELFRNLVTAQGTRAARDREELLSVFGDKGHDLSSKEAQDRAPG
ncbi:MAG: serine/threonine-protein kinase [Acidobacteriota bacterium]